MVSLEGDIVATETERQPVAEQQGDLIEEIEAVGKINLSADQDEEVDEIL